MKVTVELSDIQIEDIRQVTGVRKKGPAIRRLIEDTLQNQRRTLIADKFLSGEWATELKDYEATKTADRTNSKKLSGLWRD